MGLRVQELLLLTFLAELCECNNSPLGLELKYA